MKIEIYQKAHTIFAGTETGAVDVLIRTYEGNDAEENAKSFLAKPGREVFYSKKISGKKEDQNDNIDEGNEEEGDVNSYAELTGNELKAEIKARGLKIPAGAKKEDLIKILEDSDK